MWIGAVIALAGAEHVSSTPTVANATRHPLIKSPTGTFATLTTHVRSSKAPVETLAR
jgi:hypothetical protein